MPFFDYVCPSCDFETEELVKHHTDVVLCAWCQIPKTKLLSAPPRYRDHTVNDGLAASHPPDSFRPKTFSKWTKRTKR
jgi:hypothetical protein